MKNYPKTAEEILCTLDIQQKEITKRLRVLVKNTLPITKETIKRGSITYTIDDRDFCRIRNYKNHVDLGFFNGDRLSSPLLKTRGRGKSWRHAEIATLTCVDDPKIKSLLERGAELFQL